VAPKSTAINVQQEQMTVSPSQQASSGTAPNAGLAEEVRAIPVRHKPRWQQGDLAFVILSLVPAALLVGVLVFVPVAYTFGLSFFEQSTLRRNWAFSGLGNFTEIMSDPTFWRAFWNGLVYTAGTTVVAGLAGLMVALLLNRPFRGRGLVRALVIFPYIVPTIIVVFVWKFIFSSRGIVNDLLRQIGASGPGVPWLGDDNTAMLVVILVSAWAWFPFVAITLLAALQNLPDSVYEAATLDGASAFSRFWHLTLPLLAPAFLIIILIRAIWAFRNFEVIWLLTGGGPIGATEVLPILAYREAFGSFRMGHASAVAVTLMLFVTLLALLYFRVGARLRHAVHGT
jgi:multiple sugar transport system permease protein